MGPGERRLLHFIATRLESMLRRPEVWGSNLSVEQGILQLLEIRHLLLDRCSDDEHGRHVMRAFDKFIQAALPRGSPEPLAIQLEKAGRQNDFASLMERFVKHDLEAYVIETNDRASGSRNSLKEAEQASKMKVIEMMRADAAAEAERPRRGIPVPIDFSLIAPHS